MADILLETQSGPSSPSAGQGIIFVDSQALILATKDANGKYRARSVNGSIAAQGAGFASDTYLTDSDLLLPSWNLQVRTVMKWQISLSKSGASTGTPVISLRIGTARTTGDTARLTITMPAQTAIADIATLNIMAIVRAIGASAVIQGTAWFDHRGTAANTTTQGVGFANDGTGHTETTGGTFDSTAIAANSYVGLSLNGGAASSWTVTQVNEEADW